MSIVIDGFVDGVLIITEGYGVVISGYIIIELYSVASREITIKSVWDGRE